MKIKFTDTELEFIELKKDKFEQAYSNKTLVLETLVDRLTAWAIYKKIKNINVNKKSNMSCSSCAIGVYSEIHKYLIDKKTKIKPSKPNKMKDNLLNTNNNDETGD